MAADAAAILELRNELEARFGRAVRPAGAPGVERFEGFRTGLPVLDGLLAHGIARGTLSVWTGEATAGRTAALRALVLHSCAEGARVAVVDAGRTLDASFGCTLAGPVEGLWVVRPPDADRSGEAGWAAEMLLRAGVFDLVVLDGGVPGAAQAHRLRSLARERNAAVVVSADCEWASAHRRIGASGRWSGGGDRRLRTDDPAPRALTPDVRADVRLEFRRAEGVRGSGLRPGGRFRRGVRVVLAKHATSAPARGEREVEVVHEAADRLCTHTPVPDRSPGGR